MTRLEVVLVVVLLVLEEVRVAEDGGQFVEAFTDELLPLVAQDEEDVEYVGV